MFVTHLMQFLVARNVLIKNAQKQEVQRAVDADGKDVPRKVPQITQAQSTVAPSGLPELPHLPAKGSSVNANADENGEVKSGGAKGGDLKKVRSPSSSSSSHSHSDDHDHFHGAEAIAELMSTEQSLSTYMLMAGVVGHSIIIGVTLGLAEDDFAPLFIAICFHQFFEGFALASMLIRVVHSTKIIAASSILYAITTPIGIAVGLAARASTAENPAVYVTTTGVFDAVAAGILLYDGLANVALPHFSSYHVRCGSVKRASTDFFFLYLGAFAMAVVGKWA